MTSFACSGATEGELRGIVQTQLGSFGPGRGRVALVTDADRTLAPEDTGRLVGSRFGLNEEIRRVFQSSGYGLEAFAKVSNIWGKVPRASYIEAAYEASLEVHLRPGWKTVMMAANGAGPVVVVTAGIPQVWRMALDRWDFSWVPVVGGCHPELDSFLVLPETKAMLVGVLQESGWRVLAAGDSPIDLQMLRRADMPVFVPDSNGSPSMKAYLTSIPGIRHLVLNEDEDLSVGLPTWKADDLTSLLSEKEGAE